MTIPALVNQEVNGQFRSVPAASSLVCVLGCASAGTDLEVWLGARVTDLVSAYGYGPGPELAAVKAAAGLQVGFIKLPTVTPGVAGSVTFTGTGDSVVTVTGTPYDTYSVIMEVLKAGTVGTDGIQIRYSLNGGKEYSAPYYLGTAVTFAIPNTGVTLNFAAGDLDLGDTAEFELTEPLPDSAGIQSAIEALRTHGVNFDCIALATPASAALLTAMNSKIVSLKTHGKHMWGLAGWAIPGTAETDAAYASATNASLNTISTDKIGLTTWSADYISSISGYLLKRTPLFAALNVLTPAVISENSAAISGHQVPALLADEDGNQIYHDALYDESLSDRTITLRTWPGQPGVYITRARLLSAPADSAQLIIHRRLVNRAEQLADAYFATVVNTPIEVAPNGTISPEEAIRIEQGMQAALEDGMGNDVSGVVYKLDRLINILTTSKLEGDVYIQPFAYPETIVTRIALVAELVTEAA